MNDYFVLTVSLSLSNFLWFVSLRKPDPTIAIRENNSYLVFRPKKLVQEARRRRLIRFCGMQYNMALIYIRTLKVECPWLNFDLLSWMNLEAALCLDHLVKPTTPTHLLLVFTLLPLLDAVQVGQTVSRSPASTEQT